jgi:hypothetical protein
VTSGLNQVLTYTRDFHQPTGYLVIFKTCPEDLQFDFERSDSLVPFITFAGRTLYLLVIDICQYNLSASKRGTNKAYRLVEKDVRVVLTDTSGWLRRSLLRGGCGTSPSKTPIKGSSFGRRPSGVSGATRLGWRQRRQCVRPCSACPSVRSCNGCSRVPRALVFSEADSAGSDAPWTTAARRSRAVRSWAARAPAGSRSRPAATGGRCRDCRGPS